MASIHVPFVLEDRFSNPMAQCIRLAEQMSGTLNDMRYSMANVETAASATAVEMQNLSSRMSQTSSSGGSLLTTIRNLAGAFLGMQSVQWLVGTSDQLTQINARLQLMTGSAEAAAEANEQIYQAAMRARGGYADMADMVTQLGMMAGDAFNNDPGEIVAFAEQIQKQMAISGASGQSAAAAMTQLTQALAAGVLRGEELNSVLEQTPMITKTIADYMGVTTGELREMASEGAITADVVKNAMFAAAEETNAAFAQMPMTWSQVWTQMQNTAIRALDSVLSAINWVANNLEIVGPAVMGLGAAFTVFMVAANWVNICAGATAALAAAQAALGAVMATTWAPVLIIITSIAAAFYAVVGAINQATGASLSATGLITGAVMTAGAIVANLFIAAVNVIIGVFVTFGNVMADLGNFVGNVFVDPAKAIVHLFSNIADAVLGMLQSVAGAIDTIFGSELATAVSGWRTDLDAWVDTTYGKQVTYVTPVNLQDKLIDRFTYSDVFGTGYNLGANFDPFGVASAGTGFDTSQYTTGISPYNQLGDISGQLSGIGSSVKGIEKSVDMSDEDIKALVDVAERRYVNQVNLTSQTPVITVNGANTGRTAQDRRALADAIEQVLREEWASGSVRSTAYA